MKRSRKLPLANPCCEDGQPGQHKTEVPHSWALLIKQILNYSAKMDQTSRLIRDQQLNKYIRCQDIKMPNQCIFMTTVNSCVIRQCHDFSKGRKHLRKKKKYEIN